MPRLSVDLNDELWERLADPLTGLTHGTRAATVTAFLENYVIITEHLQRVDPRLRIDFQHAWIKHAIGLETLPGLREQLNHDGFPLALDNFAPNNTATLTLLMLQCYIDALDSKSANVDALRKIIETQQLPENGN